MKIRQLLSVVSGLEEVTLEYPLHGQLITENLLRKDMPEGKFLEVHRVAKVTVAEGKLKIILS